MDDDRDDDDQELGEMVGGFAAAGNVDPRLAAVFKGKVPPAELKIWASMPPTRREKALQRINALDAYIFAAGELPARTAAKGAAVTRPRFYQMARAWRDKRSLANVGAYAEAPKSRERFDPTVVNAIQSAVVRVVRDNPDASVAARTRLLAAACVSLGGRLPRHSTLRVFVEREIARRREEGLAGAEVLFDCSLSSIPVDGEATFTVFLAIDRVTGLIFGAGVGDAGDSVAGYRLAAADALVRLRGSLASSPIWSPRMLRSQLVPGEDVEAIGCLAERASGSVGGAAPQLLAAGKYGVYARTRLGLKIGPIQLLPSRTSRREVPTREAMDRAGEYARDRLDLEIAGHNAAVMSALSIAGSDTPPGNLLRLLETLAAAE